MADSLEFRSTARFDIRRRLGAGGMGVVYHAYDGRRKEHVALKTLLRADPASLYLFKQEFRNLADVVHRNLVNLYELLYDEGHWFFTMELLEGCDVLQYIRHGGGPNAVVAEDKRNAIETGTVEGQPPQARAAPTAGLSPSQLERLRHAVAQMGEGLIALHAKGFLHRDIKPSNVLVTLDHRVVIVDFGLSSNPSQSDETLFGPVFGTPVYMAPERADGDVSTPALDWYAVGVIMYEALTGRRPFVGDAMDILAAKCDREASPPSMFAAVPTDLDELCSGLLQRDPGKRPCGDDILRLLRPSSRVPVSRTSATSESSSLRNAATQLVGRERELAILDAAYGAAHSGHAAIVSVHGSSGVGKTALLRRFFAVVQQRHPHALVLSGRCYEREAVPYKGVDGIIDRLSHYLLSLPPSEVRGMLPRGTGTLALLFPVLRRVEAVAADDVEQFSDPLTLRRTAIAALSEMLVRIGDRTPVVLAIDDLQWADPDSIALLEEIMRPPRVPPLLLIVTLRTEAIARRGFLHRLLERRDDCEQHTLELHGLTPTQSHALALGLLHGIDASARDAALDVISRESDGNPFLIEQLVGAMTSVGESPTAMSLSDLVAMRVQRLPVQARLLVEALAVAGRPTSLQILCSATGIDAGVGPMVAALRGAQMIGAGSSETLEIYHDRLRETLLALLSTEETRQLHMRLVRALDELGDADPETLYEHHLGAGHKVAAGDAALAAATRAAAALAFDRAALFYRRSIELSELNGPERARRTALIGEALANAGRTREAADAFLEAAILSSEATAILGLRRRAAEQLLFGGHIDAGVDVVRTVLRAFGMRLPRGPRLALLALLRRRAQLRIRGISFTERPPMSIPEDELLKIDACYAVATGLGLVNLVSGAYFQSTQLLLALRAGDPYRISRALAIEAASIATAGGPARERAAEILRAAEALARRLDVPHAVGLCSLAGGIAAFLCGQWQKSAKLCDEANDILREHCRGATWELTNATLFAISAMYFQGELAEMRRRIALVLPEARNRGNVYVINDIQTRFNIMWLAAGDLSGAIREANEGFETWSRQGFHRQHYNAMRALVEVELYRRRPDVALTILQAHWPALEKSLLMRVQVLRLEAYFLRSRVCLALAATRTDRRPLLGSVVRDAKRISSESMVWSDPMGAVLRAGVARLTGRADEAIGELTHAMDGFDLAGMRLHASAARLEMGQLKGGGEGARLIAEAGAWMKTQSIRHPDALASVFNPTLVGEAP